VTECSTIVCECIQFVLAAIILFLIIIICILKDWAISISNPPLYMLSENWMTNVYHSSARSACNEQPVDQSTSLQYILPVFHNCSHPAPDSQFAWPTSSNFEHLNHLHLVWAESSASECIDLYSMPVVIHLGSNSTLTATSITCISWVTYIV